MTIETFLANFGHLADAPNGARKLRELVLQLAVQGKLVPQDPKDELAAKLLERIRKEKASKGVACRAPANPVTPDEMSYELPQAWEWVCFGDIAQHNAGKTLDKGRNTGQLRDYITTSNLRNSGDGSQITEHYRSVTDNFTKSHPGGQNTSIKLVGQGKGDKLLSLV